MSIGLNKDNTTTAGRIMVQYGGPDDVPQDEGEDLIKLTEDMEEE